MMQDEDTPGYLDEWASKLVDALSPEEFRALLAHHRALANNPRLAKADRQVARKRARYLRKKSVTES